MSIQVDVIKAKDGTDIFQLLQDGKKYMLNSTYHPVAEAERFIKQADDLVPRSVLAVFGFGNGIFPEAIAKECMKREISLVFYEPCREIMECLKEQLELQGFCNEYHCRLASLQDWEQGEYLYGLEEFPLLLEEVLCHQNMTKVYCIALPKYKELFPEEYKNFREAVNYRITRLQSNAYTSKLFGHLTVRNNIQNLRYLPDSYCGDSFVNLFPEELPAIIVSAGPSLEKNIHVLKEAKGKAFILCVDTAMRNVLKAGIVPDMMISIDSRKALDLFDDQRIRGIPLAGMPDMKAEVLDKLSGSPVIFFSSQNNYVRKLYHMAGHEIPDFRKGGSVATSAYSFCQYMGFKRVILVGQDLALTGDQMYAGEQKLDMKIFNREVRPVEDVYGGTVYTTTDYYFYLKWFEQSIAAYPEMEVIDATEGGAKITGSKIMTLKEAIDTYGMDACDIPALLASVKPAFDEQQRQFIKKDVAESKRRIANLIVRLRQGIEDAERAIALARKGTATQEQYNRINKKLTELCDYYEDMDEWYLVQYEIDATVLDEYTNLFNKFGDKTVEEAYGDMKAYFNYLLQAVKQVKELYDELEWEE